MRCNVQVAVKCDSMSRLRWRGSQIFSSKHRIYRSFGETVGEGPALSCSRDRIFLFFVLFFCSDVVVLTKEIENLFIRIYLFFVSTTKETENTVELNIYYCTAFGKSTLRFTDLKKKKKKTRRVSFLNIVIKMILNNKKK